MVGSIICANKSSVIDERIHSWQFQCDAALHCGTEGTTYAFGVDVDVLDLDRFRL